MNKFSLKISLLLRSVIETFQTYLRLTGGKFAMPLGCTALFALAGMTEGMAMMTLVSVINLAIGRQPLSGLGHWIMTNGPSDSPGGVYTVVVLFSLVGAASIGLGFASRMLTAIFRGRLEETLRRKLLSALFRIRWEAYVSQRISQVTKAIVMDGWQAASGFENFLNAVGSALVVLVLLITAVIVSPLLSVCVVLFFICMSGVLVFFSRHRNGAMASYTASSKTVSELTAEIASNLKYWKSKGAESEIREQMETRFAAFKKDLIRLRLVAVGTSALLEASGVLFIALFLIANVALGSKDLIGHLVFLGIFHRMIGRMTRVYEFYSAAREHQPWARSWTEVYAVAIAHAETPTGTVLPRFQRRLDFEAVSFVYEGHSTPVIRNLSWTLEAGRSLAILGNSGAGKSTVLDLVTGLLRPCAGQVTLDGVPLNQLDMEQWRRRIGLVLQDAPIFHATFLENIAWFDTAPDRKKAEECARMAFAWEFIEGLPGRLDYNVGEKGGRLSGGQRQRLAIARALYRDPWLLIFDEATNALDRESEAAVLEALRNLKGKVSMLIVAHHAGIADLADATLVIHSTRRVPPLPLDTNRQADVCESL